MGAGLAHKDIKKLKNFFLSKEEVKKSSKTAKQMEKHLKGVANHWRISILLLVSENDGLSVEGVSEALNGNFKTISEHLRRLAGAGLVSKKYLGHNIIHSLTPYGKKFTKFLTEFQNS
jgi:predicted transcriptional regulator